MLKTRLKHLLLDALGHATGRHAQLLPREAGDEGRILHAQAPYRVTGGELVVDIQEPLAGSLTAELLGYEGHFPMRTLWSAGSLEYPGPCPLSLDLDTGQVTLAHRVVGQAPVPLPGRRLSWRLSLVAAGVPRARLTGHYRVSSVSSVSREYFEGDNYVDHAAQSAGEGREILGWLTRYQAHGPVLEVGCATGQVLRILEQAGLAAFGLDISDWAVARAREQVGEQRVFVCNAERDPFPAEVQRRAPFGALVLWSVFEHFREPFAALRRLSALCGPDTLLLLQATNCESLTHRLFAEDWEGYFDATHLGIDQVSVASLRHELPRLGWRIERLHTHLIWTSSADPEHATLREWYEADARFRRLLEAKDLGDLVLVVARRAAGGA